jgi:hypothetical protein
MGYSDTGEISPYVSVWLFCITVLVSAVCIVKGSEK